MTWRVARSLDTLLDEVNRAAPRRGKASDGSIGDAAHASRTSDHNPWVKDASGVGVVRARDFTHDPQGGMSAAQLATDVAALLGKHPALGTGAYVIWNHRIISTSRLSEGWRPYTGSNKHTQHVHVSVGVVGYDSTAPWGVLKPAAPPKPPVKEVKRKQIDKQLGEAIGDAKGVRNKAKSPMRPKVLAKVKKAIQNLREARRVNRK